MTDITVKSGSSAPVGTHSSADSAPSRSTKKLGITNVVVNVDWSGAPAAGAGAGAPSGLDITVSVAGLNLTSAQQSELHQIAGQIGNGMTPGLSARWSAWVAGVAANGGAVDVNALVQSVLRDSYNETTEDLRFYAEKVKYFNECKKLLRDNLTALRKLRADATEYATKVLGVTDLTQMTPEQQEQMSVWMLTHGNKAANDFYGPLAANGAADWSR